MRKKKLIAILGILILRYFLKQKSDYSPREQWLPSKRSYLKEKVLQSLEEFVGLIGTIFAVMPLVIKVDG